MERLTKKIDSYTVFPEELIGVALVPDNPIMCKMLLRLAAYEDTGLTPESVEALKLSMMGKAISEITEFNGLPIDRLKELAAADREGRVVLLPCQSERLTMADYIRRETAVNAILGEPTDAHYPEWYAQILMKLPTADGAPVVHCRECEHSYEAVGGRVCTYGVCVDCEVPEDFFCFYGERKNVG